MWIMHGIPKFRQVLTSQQGWAYITWQSDAVCNFVGALTCFGPFFLIYSNNKSVIVNVLNGNITLSTDSSQHGNNQRHMSLYIDWERSPYSKLRTEGTSITGEKHNEFN
jgi:hypothetical protein